MDDLNKMLAEAEANATHAETLARQLEAEIKKIPGAAASLPKRQYGTPVSADAIARNLTLNGLINRYRPDIAAYLGIADGSDQRRQEEAAARALQAEAMRMKTEALREQNQAARAHVERAFAAGINPLTNRRMGQ